MDETRKDIIRKLETDDYLPEEVIAEIKRLRAALEAAEQRAAEAEAHLRALLEEMINMSIDEDGYQLCPWCTGRLNQKRTHQKNCPRQAAVKRLEEHVPHEHG